MSTSQVIHFDSINGAVYNTGNNFNSYTFNTDYLSTSPNSFNATFNLSTPLRNIKKINLKSVEIPIGWNNIRANSRLNIIGLATGYNATTKTYANIYSVSLPDKTYSNIATLITDINLAFFSYYPSVNIVFTLTNGYINITSTNSTVFTNYIYVVPTNLTYLLGFRSNYDIYSLRSTTAPAVYMLNIDNYINMYISNLSSSNTHNANGVISHFKIITNSINGVIYYVAENNSFEQSISVNPSIPITNLSVILTDRYGYSLNSSGLDWSFSLEFET